MDLNGRGDRVGAYEAKTHFSELLERVAAGEEITITRHGSPVARLVPVQRRVTEQERSEIFKEMRRLSKGQTLRGLNIAEMIAEGRR